MNYIEWSPLFSVGIKAIDAQHKHLLNLINDFCASHASHGGHGKVPKALHGLVDYAQTHFRDEEKLMKDYGYERYENQCRDHEQLMEEIFELQSEFEKGNLRTGDELVEFLRR